MVSSERVSLGPGLFGRVFRSTALRVALLYGVAGVGFAGANLLLARALSKAEFGLFSLVLALLYLSVPLATAGADGVINRQPTAARAIQVWRVVLTGSLFGCAVTLAARAIYGIDPVMSVLLFTGIVLGAGNFLASAHFQSRQRFWPALTLAQGANFVLLAAAVLALAFGVRNSRVLFAALVAWYAVACLVGWHRLFRGRADPRVEQPALGAKAGTQYPWRESLSYAGVTGGYLALVQMERLVTPKLLDFEALATFAVLAAVAGSPFRILQQGVGYTMLPRLRAAETEPMRKKILREELLVIGGVAVAAAILIWFFAPIVVRLVAGAEYDLGAPLIFAALVSGFAKLGSTFMRSLVTALGDTRDLAILNGAGWVMVALGLAAATVGARFGLEGILYGVAVAWLGRGIVAARLGLPRLARPATSRSEPPVAAGASTGAPT